jgi:hypothetical protein
MDIDRLHSILSGNTSSRGCGKTTAMLILALQNSDFSDTAVVILTASENDTVQLVREFCNIAYELNYETRLIREDEIMVKGDFPTPTIYKFMSFNLPDKVWLSAQGDAVGLAVWDHRAKEVKAILQRKGKIGPNELCPCGSGVKYKYCHGRQTARPKK